jgi:2,4-dienoyl-CoA reductase-like NADH-dependent reductase (Old Yellow Enzyme family)
MPSLFSPLAIRDVTLRNRVGVSPMCQYRAVDGFADDWHLVHLGSRAVGGAGLVCVEASAVEARGRISPGDLGIYDDRHVDGLGRIARFVAAQGAVPAIQIAHAGRKASVSRPWEGDRPLTPEAGGWSIIAPSALPYTPAHAVPQAAGPADLAQLTQAFVAAAQRALAAGFHLLEVHGAHGYLLHSFLSPLSNQRTDAYGGSFANRCRFPLEVVAAVRAAWPERLPLFVRLSCSDWLPGGWDIEQTVELSRQLAQAGVDGIDCSSGGLAPQAVIPVGAGYQVPFAEQVKRASGCVTAAVGMITQAMQADELVRNGRADLVLMAREFLRDPYWVLRHAPEAHAQPPVPVPYRRAFPAT